MAYFSAKPTTNPVMKKGKPKKVGAKSFGFGKKPAY